VPNGHKILADGSHVLAGLGTVVHLSPDGSRLLDSLITAPDGSPLGSPNDIALDAHSGFYLTAPGATDDDFVHYRGRVFHADSLLHLTLAADSLCYPNGIVVHPDGRFLYLDDGCEGRVYRFSIGADARLGSRQLFATIPDTNPSLDGMTFDARGAAVSRALRVGAGGSAGSTGTVDPSLPERAEPDEQCHLRRARPG
jgi:sugar lactone lactonase YvrE